MNLDETIREEAFRLIFPDSRLLARVERLTVAAGRRIKGSLAGKRRSSSLGGSQEFADYRPYALGDDTRRIDWNVYGRTGKAYIRQYWDEQELHVHLYIDASRSMTLFGEGESNKLLYALRLAACVGSAALGSEDRVSVRVFRGSRIAGEMQPIRGRGATAKLLPYLANVYRSAQAEEQGGEERNGVAVSDMSIPFRIPGGMPRKAGSAWIITDAMFETGIEETLLTLAAAGQEVVLLHVLSPEELDPSYSGELKLIDSELGTGKEVAVSSGLLEEYKEAVRAYCEELRTICADRGAAYVPLNTGRSLDEAVSLMLRTPNVLRQR